MKPIARNLDFGIFLGLSLAAITVLAYLPVRHHHFLLFDDADYVTDNPMVQAGLTAPGVKWAFTQFHSSNWHPLTWLSHMLDVQLFGHGASGPHLVNVLLHAANAALVFVLLRTLTGALWRSACVAALFALHPLRVESVAWVAERKDMLSAFFGLLALWSYAKYVAALQQQNRNSKTYYAWTLVLFVLGLMSKPMLVTWPCVMLLLDFWPLGRAGNVAEIVRFWPNEESDKPKSHDFGYGGEHRSWAHLIGEKIPFFLLSGISCVITFAAQQQSGVVGSLTRFPIGERIANALVSYTRYLEKTVWPSNLAAFYPHPGHWPMASVLVAAILIAGGCAAAVWLRRKAPFVAVGWLWFLGILIPTIGLVQVSDQSMADRYTYLPSIGVSVILVWGIAEIVTRWRLPKIAASVAAGCALLACIVGTEIQLRHWHDNETLFRHALAVTQNNFAAHYNLANALLEKGQRNEAIAEFEKTLAIRPDYADAHCNLGGALLQSNRTDEAIAHFQRAFEIQPNHGPARCNLGIVLFQQGKLTEAIGELQHAVEAAPQNVTAHFILGNFLLQQGNVDDAIAHYEKVLALHFGHADAHNNLGAALLQKKRVNDALPHFEQAVAIQPDHANANSNLADILLQRGLIDHAIVRYQKVLAVQPANADAHFNLGTSLQLKGRDDEAATHFEKVLELQPSFAPAHNNLGFILLQKGRAREALPHLQIAAELQPGNARTLAGFAWVLATCPDDSVRNGAKALALAQRANQLAESQDPEILRSLAAAYAESGRLAEAVATAQRGLQLADTRSDAALATALRSQLKLYQAGSPFRDTSAAERVANRASP